MTRIMAANMEHLRTALHAFDFPLDAGAMLTRSDVQQSAAADKVTRTFYERFKREHERFRAAITGIEREADRDWYASLMLNRLMFVCFIQEKGLLDGKRDYLTERLRVVTERRGEDASHSFHRAFLLRLFREGLGSPVRTKELNDLIGDVPYLNGGIFDEHELERANPAIAIPDEAFARLFAFFDAYRWRLDDRPLTGDDEITPDVLGYIVEKYVNQKQMGAYYTKEDITGYIGRNTLIPFLFDAARRECELAFRPEGSLWRLLRDEPDRYLHPAVRKGTDRPLPPEIAAGIDHLPSRGGWGKPAAAVYALPAETWREHIARRQRHDEIRAKLVNGEIHEINDLITWNLDIRQFAQDAIQSCEGPELLLAFYTAITTVTVLDPTCGSGAFLFAALNILQPLYDACLDRMESFIEGAEPTECEAFRAILDDVRRHPNRRWFILKSIILDNLFGVDLMEEATEICKLRLFLTLVSALDPGMPIEPLPDLDVNIRAGNALIGHLTEEDVLRAVRGDQLELDLGRDIDQRIAAFRERVRSVDRDDDEFRQLQLADAPGDRLRAAKDDRARRLASLRDELDRRFWGDCAVHSGAAGFEDWRRRHAPFHWLAEFPGAMKTGGFDVIIGNPPYVGKKKIDYQPPPWERHAFPDIYADVFLRSLALARPGGRVGMIVPLSLVFSGDYEPLRDELASFGAGWHASFDNIPAAVFSGVSQRCTIALLQKDGCGAFVTPMHRWRASFRPHLTSVISYTPWTRQGRESSALPRIADATQARVLAAHERAAKAGERFIPRDRLGACWLGVSPVARNFISAFRTPPPSFDAATLCAIDAEDGAGLPFRDELSQHAALAATAGDVCFWYWLVQCDGFHVTTWLVSDYLLALNSLDGETVAHLAALGRLLDARRFEALVFKKNAGKYVGNYNYQRLSEITRRADLVLLAGLGVDPGSAAAIIDYAQRVRSVNESAGEKGIPAALDEWRRRQATGEAREPACFSAIDDFLCREKGFARADLEFLVRSGPA